MTLSSFGRRSVRTQVASLRAGTTNVTAFNAATTPARLSAAAAATPLPVGGLFPAPPPPNAPPPPPGKRGLKFWPPTDWPLALWLPLVCVLGLLVCGCCGYAGFKFIPRGASGSKKDPKQLDDVEGGDLTGISLLDGPTPPRKQRKEERKAEKAAATNAQTPRKGRAATAAAAAAEEEVVDEATRRRREERAMRRAQRDAVRERRAETYAVAKSTPPRTSRGRSSENKERKEKERGKEHKERKERKDSSSQRPSSAERKLRDARSAAGANGLDVEAAAAAALRSAQAVESWQVREGG